MVYALIFILHCKKVIHDFVLLILKIYNSALFQKMFSN
jgi:hypothetical protein